MICQCKQCKKRATIRVMGFLNPIQKAMLGYFCKECIRLGCKSDCKQKGNL